MKAPHFWWQPPGLTSAVLTPFSMIYSAVSDRPFGAGVSSDIPVLCVGNFVAGGAGKTPTALALAELAKGLGKKPAFLTRGYGGNKSAPHKIDRNTDDVAEIGDEAMLLAELAPTVVAKDRVKGLSFLKETIPADIVIMDDGFQSAKIKPDHAMLVVDTMRGIGNGLVMPAGPLRARFETQLAHADSLLIIKNDAANHESVDDVKHAFSSRKKPVFEADLVTKPAQRQSQSERKDKVVAYCGIAHPEKFFASLENSGFELATKLSFPDHHVFRDHDASKLLEIAEREDASLFTTRKDFVRLEGKAGLLATLATNSFVLDAEVAFNDPHSIEDLLRDLVTS